MLVLVLLLGVRDAGMAESARSKAGFCHDLFFRSGGGTLLAG